MRTAAGSLLAAVLMLSGSGSSAADERNTPSLSVMSRNQYFGTDLAPVATAPDVSSFLDAARAALAEIAANDFPARAEALAREIAERRPHIVALQEVDDFLLNGGHTGAPPFIDQLELTLAALDRLGTTYVPVAQVRNLSITLPADLDGDGAPESFVSVTDRDVILARQDLADAGVVSPVPLSAVCARPSADGGPGCNYSVHLRADTPLGSFAIERGFVAVDVLLGGRVFRVVNTHLEVENLDPSNPLAPFVQSAQAAELKALIDATSGGTSIILAGDFNSTPDDPLFPDPVYGPFARPVRQFTEGVDLFNVPSPGGAYTDTWLLRPGKPAGFTCCNEDLGSTEFFVWERKDLVFSRDLPRSVKANVLGNDPADRTASGLWPSDHAGVFVRLWF
jgi:hypothetical protein